MNNAGLYRVAPIWEAKEEELDAIVGVNVKGVFAMARHAVDVMIPQGRGCILNVTSGAQAGLEGRSMYSASKAGVARAHLRHGPSPLPGTASVSTGSRRWHARGMSDMSTVGGYPTTADVPPETIAPLVVFLASDAAANVTGQIVRLQGNTLSLFSHPKPVHPAIHADGWDVRALEEFFANTLGRHLEPIGIGAETYAFYDGVGGGAERK